MKMNKNEILVYVEKKRFKCLDNDYTFAFIYINLFNKCVIKQFKNYAW